MTVFLFGAYCTMLVHAALNIMTGRADPSGAEYAVLSLAGELLLLMPVFGFFLLIRSWNGRGDGRFRSEKERVRVLAALGIAAGLGPVAGIVVHALGEAFPAMYVFMAAVPCTLIVGYVVSSRRFVGPKPTMPSPDDAR